MMNKMHSWILKQSKFSLQSNPFISFCLHSLHRISSAIHFFIPSLYILSNLLFRPVINECEDNKSNEPEFDLEKLNDTSEIDGESIEDLDLPQELLRMVEQEEKQILPYKENFDCFKIQECILFIIVQNMHK